MLIVDWIVFAGLFFTACAIVARGYGFVARRFVSWRLRSISKQVETVRRDTTELAQEFLKDRKIDAEEALKFSVNELSDYILRDSRSLVNFLDLTRHGDQNLQNLGLFSSYLLSTDIVACELGNELNNYLRKHQLVDWKFIRDIEAALFAHRLRRYSIELSQRLFEFERKLERSSFETFFRGNWFDSTKGSEELKNRADAYLENLLSREAN